MAPAMAKKDESEDLIETMEEEYKEEDDEIVELRQEQPQSIAGKLFAGGKMLVSSAVSGAKWVLGVKPPPVQGPKTMSDVANEYYQTMVKNVRAHFRTSILFFPLKLSYPVFELSAKINTGGISLYDVLPASIQPDEPIDVRMASINETSTLLWLLDRVLPVTRWAVQMISSVPRRLAQVLVVPMALMKEAASRTAFKAIIEYKKAKVDSGEAKGGEKPVVEAPKETGPPRDIAELLDTGVVSDEDTDAMTSGFAPPKRLYRNLYMGGYWKDTPEARRGLAMQKIVNDLQFARATYTYGKEQLKTLDDLLALLQNLGFKAHTYLNVRIADFLDLHTIDGMPPEPPKPAKGDPAAPTPPVTPPKPDLTTLKVTDVVTPVLVIIDSPEPDSPPYVFPCMHSEWHLVFEHPSGRFDLGLRFFHDMSAGARFHPRNAWNLPCWIKNRHLLAKDGWDAVLKVVEQARVYIEGVTAMDLGPNSGYGLVGVCQDSAAFVEFGAFGTVTVPQISGEVRARNAVVRDRPEMANLLKLPDDGIPTQDHLVRLAKTFPQLCGGVKVLEETRDRLVKEGFEVPEDLRV